MPGAARCESPLARAALALALTLAVAAGIRWPAAGAQDVSLGTGTRCGPPIAATPAMLPRSTPYAASATATPLPGADDGTTAAVVEAVENVAACWNDRDWAALEPLLHDELKAEWFGISADVPFPDAMARLDAAGVLGRLRIERAQFVRTDGARLATIEVRWSQAYATHADIWRFVRDDAGWRLLEISPLPPPTTGEAVGLSVRLTPDGVAVSRPRIVVTDTIALDIVNETDAPLTFTVLTTATPVDLALIVGGGSSRATGPAGFLPVAAGGKAQLRLASLPAGTYLLVANLDAAIASGDPALATVATLVVEPLERP